MNNKIAKIFIITLCFICLKHSVSIAENSQQNQVAITQINSAADAPQTPQIIENNSDSAGNLEKNSPEQVANIINIKSKNSQEFFTKLNINNIQYQKIITSLATNILLTNGKNNKDEKDKKTSKLNELDSLKLAMISIISKQRIKSDFGIILDKPTYQYLTTPSSNSDYLKDIFTNSRFLENKALDEISISNFFTTSLGKIFTKSIDEGDITDNVYNNLQPCTKNNNIKSDISKYAGNLEKYPVAIRPLEFAKNTSIEETIKDLSQKFPELSGDLNIIQFKTKAFFTIKELTNSFGDTVGILILSQDEKIPLNKEQLKEIKKARGDFVHTKIEFLNEHKVILLDKWNDESCPISYNQLDFRRQTLSECYLCKYMYITNNAMLNAAENFFRLLQQVMLGLIVIIFCLWVALTFWETIRKEIGKEGGDPNLKGWVMSVLKKPIRIIFFMSIIFISPRITADIFFYPIVMIGSTSMEITVSSMVNTETSFLSDQEKASIASRYECDPAEEYKNFLLDIKRDYEKSTPKDIKLFPASERELQSKITTKESSMSYRYLALNSSEQDIKNMNVENEQYYIGQMTCNIKKLKYMFGGNRVLGELLIEDAWNKIDINFVNIGMILLTYINPAAGILTVSSQNFAGIVNYDKATGKDGIFLEILFGISIIVISTLLVLFIFFSFFEIMISISWEIIKLPIISIKWIFDSGSANMHATILNRMKTIGKDFFIISIAFCIQYIIYKESISFLFSISDLDINRAFVYGSKSYILNAIDFKNTSFTDLIFVIYINIYVGANLTTFMTKSIGSAAKNSSLEGKVKKVAISGVQKIISAKKDKEVAKTITDTNGNKS